MRERLTGFFRILGMVIVTTTAAYGNAQSAPPPQVEIPAPAGEAKPAPTGPKLQFGPKPGIPAIPGRRFITR